MRVDSSGLAAVLRQDQARMWYQLALCSNFLSFSFVFGDEKEFIVVVVLFTFLDNH